MPYHDQKEAWLQSRAAFHKRQGGEIENEDDDLEVVSSKESLPGNPTPGLP